MDLFKTKMTAVDDTRVTTVERKRVSWNHGLKGCFSDDTLKLISERLKNHEHRQAINKDPEWRQRQSEITKHIEAVRLARIGSRAKAEATKRANGYYDHKKMIQTPNGVFNGIKEIMLVANRSKRTVMYWMKKYPEHYYYIKDAK